MSAARAVRTAALALARAPLMALVSDLRPWGGRRSVPEGGAHRPGIVLWASRLWSTALGRLSPGASEEAVPPGAQRAG